MSEHNIIPPGQVLSPMRLDADSRPADTNNVAKKQSRRPATSGRFAVLNSFADVGAKTVDTTAQACWWILFRETREGVATVSHSRIGKCIGMSRHTAMRAIKRLEMAGLLTVVRHGGLNRGPSTYRLHPLGNSE